MKKKNGFTLIELLVVIALMLSILGIAIVSFINISNNKKKESWEDVKAQIETAAMEYFTANEYLFENLTGTIEGEISVGKLVKEDYLNKITNPTTGKSVSACAVVKVEKTGNKLTAIFDETTENSVQTTNCDSDDSIIVAEPGAPKAEVKFIYNGIEHDSFPTWLNKSHENPKVKVYPDTNGQGAIASTTINNDEKEVYEITDEIKNKALYIVVRNINGKEWRRMVSYSRDVTSPSCSYNVTGGTIGNKIGETQWYKGGIPTITYTGNDTLSDVEGIYQYQQSGKNLVLRNQGNSYSEIINSSYKGYYNAVVKDIAGNVSEQCGGNYGYDNIPPSITVSVYKRNKNGSNGEKLGTKTGSGEDIDVNKIDISGWLNKEEAPYGVNVDWTSNETMSEEVWYWNRESLNNHDASYNNTYKWATCGSGYCNGNYSTTLNKKENTHKIEAEGSRRTRIRVKDSVGNETWFYVVVKLDRTAPSIDIRDNYAANCTSFKNGGNRIQYKNDVYIEDVLSGIKDTSYDYKYSSYKDGDWLNASAVNSNTTNKARTNTAVLARSGSTLRKIYQSYNFLVNENSTFKTEACDYAGNCSGFISKNYSAKSSSSYDDYCRNKHAPNSTLKRNYLKACSSDTSVDCWLIGDN